MSEPQEVNWAFSFFYGSGDVDCDFSYQSTGHTRDHCTFAPVGVLLLYYGLILRIGLRKKTVKPLRNDSLKYFVST